MGSIRDRILAEEEEKKKNGDNTSGSRIRDRLMSKDKVQEIGSKIQDRVNNWLSNSNSYFESFNYRYKDYDTSTYRLEESNGWKNLITAQKDWFTKEAENIDKLLTDYENYFDKEWVSNVRNAVSSVSKEQEKVMSLADEDVKYWSQWGSAEEYEKLYDNTTYGKKYEGMTYADIQKALESSKGRVMPTPT